MPRRMLIVDPDEATLLALSDHFSGHGFRVDCALRVEDAYTHLANAEYSVVIADVDLSNGMSDAAVELFRTVQQESTGARSILYSRNVPPDVEGQAHDVGIHCVLSKPTSVQVVAETVLELMTEPSSVRTIQGYELEDEIGVGGVGTIWRAKNRATGQIVAIKELHPSLSKDTDFIGRFQREAKVAKTLAHDNIVRLLEYGEDNGTHFLAMEYIDGCDLEQPLRRIDRVIVPIAVTIVIDVLQGLEHAHNHGVIHRDIKPGNILIDVKGVSKLADFSIARATQLDSVTTSGNIFGTPPYMSPEQVRGDPIDHRTDIFSLGTLTYELLTGERPFDGPTYPLTIDRLLNHNPLPVHKVNPLVPKGISRLVERMLEKQREKRPQTARQLLEVLEIAVKSEELMSDHGLVGEFIRDPVRLQREIRQGRSRTSLRAAMALSANAETLKAAVKRAWEACLWDPDNIDAQNRLEQLRWELDQAGEEVVLPEPTGTSQPGRPEPGDVRRAHSRHSTVSLEVSAEFGSESLQARMFATDISEGGAFLECADPPEMGTILRINLPVTPRRVLSLGARVAHVVTTREAAVMGAIPGAGVQFEDLTDGLKRLIDQAITRAAESGGIVSATTASRLPAPKIARSAAVQDEALDLAQRLLASAKQALEQRLYVKAASDLHLAAKCDPQSEEIKTLAADAARKAGEAKAALLFRQGEYLQDSYRRELLKRPAVAARTLEGMFRCFRDAATLAPQEVEYQRRAAEAALQVGDLDAAVKFGLQAVELEAQEANLFALLARIHHARGELSEAVAAIQTAIQLAPDRDDLQLLRKQLRKSRWSRSVIGFVTDLTGEKKKS